MSTSFKVTAVNGASSRRPPLRKPFRGTTTTSSHEGRRGAAAASAATGDLPSAGGSSDVADPSAGAGEAPPCACAAAPNPTVASIARPNASRVMPFPAGADPSPREKPSLFEGLDYEGKGGRNVTWSNSADQLKTRIHGCRPESL